MMTYKHKQARVLPQCSNAACETDDKDDRAGDDEYEPRVQEKFRQFANVIKHLLLVPSP